MADIALTEPSAAEPTALDTAAALVLTYSEYTGFTPEELVEGLIALHLTPPEPLRSHLERTALRESKLPGVPVGAFLVHRSRASALCAAVGALGQRTFLCAPLCWPEADDDWLVLRARAATASALAADAETVRRIEKSCGATYFVGVRRCDSCLRPYKHDWKQLPSGLEAHDASTGGAFTFAELFAGVGGFRLGLEACGGRCIFASEIDAACRETYTLNFGAHGLGGDVCDVYAQDLPPFDLLTAGFPCQPFSERGEQAGLACRKGGMYLELVRVLRVCQPKAFLFENVPALATLGGGDGATAGSVLAAMLAAFESAGYRVSWRVLNARRWVAQKRRRLFIVGFRSDTNAATGAFEWPDDAPPERPPVLRDVLEPRGSASVERCALTAAQWEAAQSEARHRGPRLLVPDAAAPTLISSYRTDQLASKFVAGDDGAPPRWLTPRECSRLMGFPETFVLPEPTGERGHTGAAAEAAPYRMLGNAVVPPLVRAIGERMVERL